MRLLWGLLRGNWSVNKWEGMIYGLVVLQRRRTNIRLPRLAVYDINHTLNPINSADSWNRTTDLWARSPMLYLWAKSAKSALSGSTYDWYHRLLTVADVCLSSYAGVRLNHISRYISPSEIKRTLQSKWEGTESLIFPFRSLTLTCDLWVKFSFRWRELWWGRLMWDVLRGTQWEGTEGHVFFFTPGLHLRPTGQIVFCWRESW